MVYAKIVVKTAASDMKSTGVDPREVALDEVEFTEDVLGEGEKNTRRSGWVGADAGAVGCDYACAETGVVLVFSRMVLEKISDSSRMSEFEAK